MTDFFHTNLFRETGTSHLRKGRPCEDHVARASSEDHLVKVIALADGAGSYRNAELGARIVSETAAQMIAKKFDVLYALDEETAAQYILQETTAPLRERVRQTGGELIDYSCTLLLAALHYDGRYFVFHIGDGVVVGYHKSGICKTISRYEHDGPVNQATFVTVENTEYHLSKGKNDYYAFFLMSDGPEEYLVDEVSINPHVYLMCQRAFFLSEERMTEYLGALVSLLKDKRMFDDASFAILNDVRATASVFTQLAPSLMSVLFKMDSASKKEKQKAVNVLRVLSLHPKGLTANQLAKALHVKSKYVRKKMSSLVNAYLIDYKNGRYYLSD